MTKTKDRKIHFKINPDIFVECS